jgi:hypothetical protein
MKRHSSFAGCRFFLNEDAMKKLVHAAVFALLAAVSAAVMAESKTITLSVSGMT